MSKMKKHENIGVSTSGVSVRKRSATSTGVSRSEAQSRAKRGSAIVLILIILSVLGCVGQSDYDTNKELPPGEPAFPPEKVYGIVDPNHTLSMETIQESDAILEGLKRDGIAEVVVLIQSGVKNPELYATRYGRYIGLGEKGKNNGLVWLIRPDVDPEKFRITYSVGRGLPRLTSTDLGDIMEQANDPINFGNYDLGVLSLVKGTDLKLRQIYK